MATGIFGRNFKWHSKHYCQLSVEEAEILKNGFAQIYNISSGPKSQKIPENLKVKEQERMYCSHPMGTAHLWVLLTSYKKEGSLKTLTYIEIY